jgi:mRNA-degrading endonuclease YafQ of YafQ-DinJ toxin-antitoxin module
MTRVITRTSTFKKDYKRMQKRGYVMGRLFALLQFLVEGKKLEDELGLTRTGTHSDLFK